MSVKLIQTSLIISSAILLAGCGGSTQSERPAPPPASVTVEKIVAAPVAYYDEYPGTIKALQEVELRPQVSGYITAIHFNEGQRVKKGQKLYSIDMQQSAASYQQAQANLSVQEANLLKAKKDVERYRELDKQDAIAKQQVDYAEAAYTAAQKQVDAAKAMVQSAQTNVRYSTIVAPFDGTIGISQVKLGASVSPGQTLLNTISSNDPIAVDISVDQRDIFKFSQLLDKPTLDSTFQLTFDNIIYPNYGKLSFIDRAVDAQTGTIKIRIEFPNPKFELRPGMSGTLRILTKSDNKTIAIPYKAVTEQLGEFFVFVVGEGNIVTQQKVVPGKQVGTRVIIPTGLKDGETIVIEGVQKLRQGAQVSFE